MQDWRYLVPEEGGATFAQQMGRRISNSVYIILTNFVIDFLHNNMNSQFLKSIFQQVLNRLFLRYF